MPAKKSASFDAAALDTVAACNKPFEIEIKHPTTGDGTGLFISVVGRDSDLYRSRIRSLAEDEMRQEASGKFQRKGLDEQEKDTIDALVAATVSWRSSDDPDHILLDGEAL